MDKAECRAIGRLCACAAQPGGNLGLSPILAGLQPRLAATSAAGLGAWPRVQDAPARGSMIYRTYQAQSDLLAPARLAAGMATAFLDAGAPWLRRTPPLAQWAASLEMLTRAGLTHHRPDYGFRTVRVGAEDVP